MQEFLIFDNITTFGNRVLYSALTAKVLSGRVLGKSAIIERPNNFIWIATGIKPSINGEMARRVCSISLDLKTDNPASITYRKNLTKWVAENRADIIWALLTLVRYWIAQGAKAGSKKLNSFEPWSETVSGILSAASIEGFLENERKEGRRFL